MELYPKSFQKKIKMSRFVSPTMDDAVECQRLTVPYKDRTNSCDCELNSECRFHQYQIDIFRLYDPISRATAANWQEYLKGIEARAAKVAENYGTGDDY